jgi:hypothetical protein
MTDLRPCTECSRHVRVDEAACPFCGGDNTAPFTPPRIPTGRLTRAAIFASALATGGAAACGTNPEPVDPTDDQTTGDDKIMQQDGTTDTTNTTPAPTPDAMMAAPPAAVDAMMAAQPPPPAPVDAGVAIDTNTDVVPDKVEWNPNHIPKPYGAPPARKRLV